MWVGFLRRALPARWPSPPRSLMPSFLWFLTVAAILHPLQSGLPSVQSLFYVIAPVVGPPSSPGRLELARLTNKKTGGCGESQ